MGFVNRAGFLNSISAERQTVVASSDVVLTGSNSIIVFVDTTSNPVNVTLPAGASGQSVEIIDAGDNAGNNIITVVGSVDGATDPTIETNGGSLVVAHSGTAWESAGGFDKFFSRNAITGEITPRNPDSLVATIIKSGDTGTSFFGDYTGDFSNAEVNVDDTLARGDGWGNTTIPIDETSGITWTQGVNVENPFPLDGGATIDEILNIADPGATKHIQLSTNSDIEFDFGAPFLLDSVNANMPASTNGAITLYGSNDSITGPWTSLYSSGYGSLVSRFPIQPVGNTTAYRYYRLQFSSLANGVGNFNQLVFNSTGYQSAANTFQYRIATGAESANYSPPSLVLNDETDTPVIDGNVLIEYSTNGSTWSSQLGLTAFKALGTIPATTFWLRFEMVGATLLKDAFIATASSFATINSSGLDVQAESVSVGKITPNGFLLTNLTEAERDAVSSPDAGLTVFNTTTNKINFYNGSAWEAVTSA